MTRTAALAPPSTARTATASAAAHAAAPEVPSRRAAGPWRRIAGALRRALRRLDARPPLDEDGRWLAAAGSLEELERRQRRLERHGSPLPPAWLP